MTTIEKQNDLVNVEVELRRAQTQPQRLSPTAPALSPPAGIPPSLRLRPRSAPPHPRIKHSHGRHHCP